MSEIGKKIPNAKTSADLDKLQQQIDKLPDSPQKTQLQKQLDKKKFDEVLKMIEQESFGEGKNAILSMVIGENGLSTEQIRRILTTYSFDDNKLEALKMCYPSVVDPENYYTLASVFTFASSKKKMAAFLRQTR